ncbi:MAG TPA: ABC transporter permease, partial [Thermoanaerobaculia bacterium]|nr:ABC transporter permease [Thermoanaerobaculia bacterium]
LCCAVAAAVLSGALVVGDSVRGSLHDLTLERLGSIDLAVRAPTFFTMDLATGVWSELAGEAHVAPLILLTGSARDPESGAVASGVTVSGVDRRFFDLFAGGGADSIDEEGNLVEAVAEALLERPTPGVVVNQALATELEVAAGDSILVAVERPGDAPRETLYGSSETSDVVRELRVEVTRVVPDRGLGRFSLATDQSLPFLAFLDIAAAQKALAQEGRANTLVVDLPSGEGEETGDEEGVEGKAEDEGDDGEEGPERDDTATLSAALQRAITPQDLGLEIENGDGWVAIESGDFVIAPPLEGAIASWAASNEAPVLSVSTYLANRLEANGRAVPYSAVAALDTAAAAPFGGFVLRGGGAAPALAENEVLVDDWVADDLGIDAGDEVVMTYFEVGPKEELLERRETFRCRGVVKLSNLAADPGLTPDFPGISGADDMREWDPPFPIDLDSIRPRDEAFWDEHRATPKAFFAPSTAKLWATRFGATTSMRIAVPPAQDVEADEAGGGGRGRGEDGDLTGARDLTGVLRARVDAELPRAADPVALGFRFDPVRERGLAASAGATDFRWLFLGFSSFLIASAAILVALFFTLGIERRASEIGLLLAAGYPLRTVRRRFLIEGLVLGAIGIAMGTAGAALYAGLMIAVLRTWWRAAVGTPFLYLHLEPLTLAAGALAAFVVVALSIALSVRRLGRLSVISLLRGATASPIARATDKPPRSRWIWRVAALLGVVLLGAGAMAGLESSPAVFFAAGASLLVAGLAFFAIRLRQPRGHLRAGARYLPMAARNATLNPGRSLLSAALVAAASFVIVAVAANGFRYGEEVDALDSPAGGYTVVAESAVPLHVDLGSEAAPFELGLQPAAGELLASSAVAAFRVLPGDDVSCLNLYQPERPRILGVPREQIERGGFHFQKLVEERELPWTLLDDELDGGAIPAFGDFESMTWILKLGLGEELVIENDRGEPIRLRLVGLLEKSLFQSELLISEENFERNFPSRTGRSFFLFDPPPGRDRDLIGALETGLDSYGLDAATTSERLDRYQAVFNTYLATFQTLGGLGLLLGTVGLAAILLRNVLERRGELATLRALGFPRASLAWLVLTENTLLLLVGLAIGAAAALLAVSPHLLAGNAVVPWLSLTVTLLLIVVVGTLAAVAAVRRALAAPLLPALKGD